MIHLSHDHHAHLERLHFIHNPHYLSQETTLISDVCNRRRHASSDPTRKQPRERANTGRTRTTGNQARLKTSYSLSSPCYTGRWTQSLVLRYACRRHYGRGLLTYSKLPGPFCFRCVPLATLMPSGSTRSLSHVPYNSIHAHDCQTYYIEVLLPSYTPSDIAWIGSLQLGLLFAVGIIGGFIYDHHYVHQAFIFGSVLYVGCIFALSAVPTDAYYAVSRCIC